MLTGEEGPERVTGRWVTASFFRTLGIRPAAGRFFTEEEDRPGGPPVLVLSHELWLRRYGGATLWTKAVVIAELTAAFRTYRHFCYC